MDQGTGGIDFVNSDGRVLFRPEVGDLLQVYRVWPGPSGSAGRQP
jgi:hypothetical protein